MIPYLRWWSHLFIICHQVSADLPSALVIIYNHPLFTVVEPFIYNLLPSQCRSSRTGTWPSTLTQHTVKEEGYVCWQLDSNSFEYHCWSYLKPQIRFIAKTLGFRLRWWCKISRKIKTAYEWRVHKRSCAYQCPGPNCPRDPMRGRNIRVFCD